MMYVPPAFAMEEHDARLLINERPFATLFSFGTSSTINRCHTTHMPMYLVAESLFGHFAHTNEHSHIDPVNYQHLAIFHGPNAYISPTWYQDQNQVPTWNYEAVHVSGELVILNDDVSKLDIVTRLTEINEAAFNPPWTIEKLTNEKKHQLLGAITGCRLDITDISGKSKLSQNKAPELENLVAGLSTHSATAKTDIELITGKMTKFLA
jgi:transcriptional regulator